VTGKKKRVEGKNKVSWEEMRKKKPKDNGSRYGVLVVGTTNALRGEDFQEGNAWGWENTVDHETPV